jgi:hypothetical protein
VNKAVPPRSSNKVKGNSSIRFLIVSFSFSVAFAPEFFAEPKTHLARYVRAGFYQAEPEKNPPSPM